MGRPVKLNQEQVLKIRENKEAWTLATWARFFGVSMPTAFAAQKGKGGYALVSEASNN